MEFMRKLQCPRDAHGGAQVRREPDLEDGGRSSPPQRSPSPTSQSSSSPYHRHRGATRRRLAEDGAWRENLGAVPRSSSTHQRELRWHCLAPMGALPGVGVLRGVGAQRQPSRQPAADPKLLSVLFSLMEWVLDLCSFIFQNLYIIADMIDLAAWISAYWQGAVLGIQAKPMWIPSGDLDGKDAKGEEQFSESVH